jgi:hypothetical protein
MMPSNRLALLAILALGYLGLLSTHVSEFATLFRFTRRAVRCSWGLIILCSVEYPEQ